MFAAAHASVKSSGNVGTTAPGRVFDEASFSCFVETLEEGVVRSRLGFCVFLDANRLKIFDTDMPGCREEVRVLQSRLEETGHIGFYALWRLALAGAGRQVKLESLTCDSGRKTGIAKVPPNQVKIATSVIRSDIVPRCVR